MAEAKPTKGSGNLAVWVVLFILVLALGGGLIYYLRSGGPTEQTAQEAAPPEDKVGIAEKKPAQVVDLNEAGKESEQAKEMERRKEELGVKKSLDAVVKEEEQVKIGDKTVAMSQIVDQIEAKEKGGEAAPAKEQSQVVEEDLGGAKKAQKEKLVAKGTGTAPARDKTRPRGEAQPGPRPRGRRSPSPSGRSP